MKKCRRCSKPATLHITEIRDGDAHVLHLCEVCAKEYVNSADESQLDEHEPFAGKLGEIPSDEELEQLDGLVCPNCKITFKEFRSQGRLGCPHDYIAFEEELMPLLENIHNETQHCGKFPKRAPHSSQRQYQLIRLRNDLRLAVEREDYEAAAELRDGIQSLEAELAAEPAESE